MTRTAGVMLGLAALAAGSLASCEPNQSADGSAPVERAVRAYIAAIDARDGARVCGDLAPAALSRFALPKRGGSCGVSITRSIGYRDPRGYPVWRHTRIGHFRSVKVWSSTARATVRVKTTFADHREPSIEDDVVYLRRDGGRWLVAKPSATLYRAVGASSPPISAFRAPVGRPPDG